MNGKEMEGVGSRALPQHLLGGTYKNHRKPQPGQSVSQARLKSGISGIQVSRLPFETACLVSAYHLHHHNHHFSELQIKRWCNRQHILATFPVPSQFSCIVSAMSSCSSHTAASRSTRALFLCYFCANPNGFFLCVCVCVCVCITEDRWTVHN
jgi:hypothetical protein